MTPATTSQILGCLHAGALGDAFASASEHTSDSQASYQPSWQVTDDTQLTQATCKAIVQAEGVSPETIAQVFAQGHAQRDFTGLGASTLGALRALVAGAHWGLSGTKGERAGGNGAAMRIAPLAFWCDLEYWGQKQQFRDVVRITHHNEEALAGAQAVALSIQHLLEQHSPDAPTLYQAVADRLFDSQTRDNLLSLAMSPPDSYEAATTRVGTTGFAAHTVPVALVAVTFGLREGLEPMFKAIVRQGGDTDTIASIAGQLFGAAKGVEALPVAWLKRIKDKERDHLFLAFAKCTLSSR